VIPIADGRLQLGTWQGIFLFEHRRSPHLRRVIVSVLENSRPECLLLGEILTKSCKSAESAIQPQLFSARRKTEFRRQARSQTKFGTRSECAEFCG